MLSPRKKSSYVPKVFLCEVIKVGLYRGEISVNLDFILKSKELGFELILVRSLTSEILLLKD